MAILDKTTTHSTYLRRNIVHVKYGSRLFGAKMCNTAIMSGSELQARQVDEHTIFVTQTTPMGVVVEAWSHATDLE